MSPSQKILVTVDALVFGYLFPDQLSVLLIKRKNPPFQDQWAIPGGFVEDYESLEEGAQRELREETGISVKIMHQLYAFGEPGRDPRGRVVSVAYWCLVDPSQQPIKAQTDAKEVQWIDVNNLPELAFDHELLFPWPSMKLR